MSSWGRRVCAACNKDLHSDEYTRTQWSEVAGVSRCRLCTAEGLYGDGELSARLNNSQNANVYNMDRPFAQGTFRWVAKGRYTSGERQGQVGVRDPLP